MDPRLLLLLPVRRRVLLGPAAVASAIAGDRRAHGYGARSDDGVFGARRSKESREVVAHRRRDRRPRSGTEGSLIAHSLVRNVVHPRIKAAFGRAVGTDYKPISPH